MSLTQEYNYNPVRTRNSSTARGPLLRDVASLEGGGGGGGGVCGSVVPILSVEVGLSVTLWFIIAIFYCYYY